MKLRTSLSGVALFLIFFLPQAAVAQTAPSVTCTLSPKEITILEGNSLTFKWKSTGATSGTITGIGPVSPQGQIDIAPSRSRDFIGTFSGPAGIATCNATVVVTARSTTGAPDASNQIEFSSEIPHDDSAGFPSESANQTQSFATQQNISIGGIVPCGSANDPGGATGCEACHIVSLLQRLINFALGLSIPIAIALFAYAGVLYFTSAANEGNISRAKKIFRSALTGIIIALGAYLVVETVLHAVLKESYWKKWNTIECVGSAHRPHDANISQVFGQAIKTFIQGTSAPGGVGVSGGLSAAPCAIGDIACNTAMLQAGGLTAAQAATMSCIAMTESGGDPSIGCSATLTPCGLYQINNGNWNAFAPSGCGAYSQKNDANCSTLTAIAMVNQNGYQPWTGHNANGVAWNPNASTCVKTYDPKTTLNW